MEENNTNEVKENLEENIKENTENNTESTETEQKTKTELSKKEKIKDALEWVVCTIIALIIVLTLKYFVISPTVVKMTSMYPTLKDSQRLFLNRTHRLGLNEIERGDIITFERPKQNYSPETADQSNPKAIYDTTEHGLFYNFLYYVVETPKVSYIKRVIGLEGDHIEIKNNKVYRNGEELKEDYISSDVKTESPVFTDFTVPEGYVFAIGDNRENSIDCRSFGCIPLEKVEGTVLCRFWPLNSISGF